MPSSVSAQRRSSAVQNPAGASAVTEDTIPRAPSSSAIAPPSELPTTCGRSRSSASKNSPNPSTVVARS